MKREDLNRALVTSFPDLMPEYLELKHLWSGEEPGPHVTYGDLLVPLIHAAIHRTSHDELGHVMEFLEELSSSGDGDTIDVIVTSVLEPLLEEEDRQRLEKAMGPRTRKLWTRLVVDVG